MNRYAIADLHGRLDLFNKVKEYLNADDIVYALGDFGDRGPWSWETLKAALDDPQFIYLMGNHDLFLIEAIEEYYDILKNNSQYSYKLCGSEKSQSFKLLRLNNGLDTFYGWAAEPERDKYFQKLKQLPLEIRLAALDRRHMIYLTHAGYTPSILGPHTVYDLLWDRDHICDEWYQSNENIMIHGHTPIDILMYLLEVKDLPYDCTDGCCVYCGGSKICIDMGAHDTKQTLLLNIDTLETKIFSTEEES